VKFFERRGCTGKEAIAEAKEAIAAQLKLETIKLEQTKQSASQKPTATLGTSATV
jgi:hypothetical protein